MTPEIIVEEFRSHVSDQIKVSKDGADRYLVQTPFRFEDGDHFTVVLLRDDAGWLLSDEANTLMHLSYWLDTDGLETGNRRQIVEKSLATFDVENRDGELVRPITNAHFGGALFDFVQALTKVTDISYLSRELVRSTFMEDLKQFLLTQVAPERIQVNWTDPHDTKKKYPVDFRINQMKKPLFVYGLHNEDKIKDATISLLTFERWGRSFQSLGVFEDQETVPRKPLARFLDVVGKSYSSLQDNEDRIGKFLKQTLQEG